MLALLIVYASCSALESTQSAEARASAYLLSDSLVRVELTYSVPHTQLTFVRSGQEYAGHFAVRALVWDDAGRLVAAEDWEERVNANEVEALEDGTRQLVRVRRMILPRRRFTLELGLEDLQSERRESWQFKVLPPKALSDVGLRRASAWPERQDRIEGTQRDTLVAAVEVYPRQVNLQSGFLIARVVDGHRTLARDERVILADSESAREEFVFCLQGYENGSYRIIVELADARHRVLDRRGAEFRVAGAFFNSERTYRERVNQLLWIASAEEISLLRTIPPVERETAWLKFWRSRESLLGRNTTEETYFERIDYSVRHFGRGDRGYRSDRAMVYVKLGPPDNVESASFEPEGHAWERWYYYGLNRSFTFRDVSGFGEFRITDEEARSFLLRL
ncbi:MAG: GWxTD domain-containing protein [candidate division WOR-3 bacterium]